MAITNPTSYVAVVATAGQFDHYVRTKIDALGHQGKDGKVRRDLYGWTIDGVRYLRVVKAHNVRGISAPIELVIFEDPGVGHSEVSAIIAAVRVVQQVTRQRGQALPMTVEWRPRRIMVLGTEVAYHSWVGRMRAAYRRAAAGDEGLLTMLDQVGTKRLDEGLPIAEQFAISLRCDLVRVTGWDVVYTRDQTDQARVAWSRVAEAYGGRSWTDAEALTEPDERTV